MQILSVATICSLSHPFLNFSVTGTFEFFTTVSSMSFAFSRSNRSLLPSPFFTTFGAGHPIFISIISAKFDTYFVAYSKASKSEPNI